MSHELNRVNLDQSLFISNELLHKSNIIGQAHEILAHII